MAFSGQGRYTFTSYSTNPAIKIWDTMKGNQLMELKGHKERVSSVGVSGDGQIKVSFFCYRSPFEEENRAEELAYRCTL